eukprot:766547-Hanusia_phi.AAC.4
MPRNENCRRDAQGQGEEGGKEGRGEEWRREVGGSLHDWWTAKSRAVTVEIGSLDGELKL